MKVEVGTIVESEYGTGPVVAITKEWLIYIGEGGLEVALVRDDGEYHIPVTEHVIGGGGQDDGMPKAGQWWRSKGDHLGPSRIFVIGYTPGGFIAYQAPLGGIRIRSPSTLKDAYCHDPDCKGWECDAT